VRTTKASRARAARTPRTTTSESGLLTSFLFTFRGPATARFGLDRTISQRPWAPSGLEYREPSTRDILAAAVPRQLGLRDSGSGARDRPGVISEEVLITGSLCGVGMRGEDGKVFALLGFLQGVWH